MPAAKASSELAAQQQSCAGQGSSWQRLGVSRKAWYHQRRSPWTTRLMLAEGLDACQAALHVTRPTC
jgi:hypothetical protein